MGKLDVKPGTMGKKPMNRAKVSSDSPSNTIKPIGRIGNKMKRQEMYGQYLMQKKSLKRELRKKRSKEAEALGEDAQHVKQVPRTLENTREVEDAMVQPDDEEVMADEGEDEFAPYFSDEVRPKILITTRPRPSAELFVFIQDLMRFIPKMYYYPRKHYSVKEICGFATNRKFTHLIVLSEKSKVCNGMIVSHLGVPNTSTTEEEDDDNNNTVHDDPTNPIVVGPTAFFKVSNVIPSTDIPMHGSATDHVPELVLNGFSTRLGHRAGRFLGSLFPHNAQFEGRQVATFHNQRDFIFVRHHRYVFEEGKEKEKETKKPKTKARLQELGPRFTIKMRWLQEGTFDTQFGEYEWIHKRKEMDTTRRKFHL